MEDEQPIIGREHPSWPLYRLMSFDREVCLASFRRPTLDLAITTAHTLSDGLPFRLFRGETLVFSKGPPL